MKKTRINSLINSIILKIFKHRNTLNKTKCETLKDYCDIDKYVYCNRTKRHIFKNAKKGDLIFFDMPLSKEELEKIPVGHRQRPYYIEKKLKNGFIGYYATSVKPNIPNSRFYSIDDKKYSTIEKISYIKLNDEVYLPKDHIINYMFSISNEESNEIDRRLYFNNPSRYTTLYGHKTKKLKVKIGDIIKYKKESWLVMSEHNSIYDLILVSKEASLNKFYFECNNNKYYIVPQKTISTQLNCYVGIVDILDKNKLTVVLNLIKENYVNNIMAISGEIFMYKKNLYYCYKSNIYNISAYRIYKERSLNKELSYICIFNDGKKIYLDISKQYTIPNTEKIDKKVFLDNENIKTINNYIKNNFIIASQQYYTDLDIGTLLLSSNDEEYIYLYSNNQCDFGINKSELYKMDICKTYNIKSLVKGNNIISGKASDNELKLIISKELFEGRDKNGILQNKYLELLGSNA